MSSSQELVSVLRERFYQSEERVDFQKTFMNYARDQTCREAKMTVMTLRQVLGVYLDIRPNDSKFKLIPEVVTLIGFTDRNMKVDCQQVIDHVFGREKGGKDSGSQYQHSCEWRGSNSTAAADRMKRNSAGGNKSASSSTRRESIKSSNCSVNSKNSSTGIAHESKLSAGGVATTANKPSSATRRSTFTRESVINSAASAPVKNTFSTGGDVDDLERQYRMAVIDLQVAEYDNKLYRKTMDQLRKQLDTEKMKHEQLKTKFEVRKRKFRNVKIKFRNQSEVLLREIVRMTNKCNEAFNNTLEESKGSLSAGKENQNDEEVILTKRDVEFDLKLEDHDELKTGGGAMGDSLIKPMVIPNTER